MKQIPPSNTVYIGRSPGVDNLTLLARDSNNIEAKEVNQPSFQLSERSTDIDLVREAVHQKRSLRTRKASESRLSRGNSRLEFRMSCCCCCHCCCCGDGGVGGGGRCGCQGGTGVVVKIDFVASGQRAPTRQQMSWIESRW